MRRIAIPVACGFVSAALLLFGQTYTMEGANRLVVARDWTNLLRYTQGWVRQSARDSNAWFYLGNTYLNGFHQPANAIAPLRRSVDLNPQSGQVWFFLGSAYREANQFADAINALRQATAREPSHLNYWIGLADAYVDREYAAPTAGAAGDSPALDALRRGEASASPATNAGAWYDLGLAYDGLNARQNAIAAYSRAIRSAPNTAEAWNNRGVDEEKTGQNQRALADYEQALRLGDRVAADNIQKIRAAMAGAAAARQSGCPAPPLYTAGPRYSFQKTHFCSNNPGCPYVFQGGQFRCP